MEKHALIDYLLKVEEIAKVGLTYSKDPYALDNYDELQRLTSRFLDSIDAVRLDGQNYFRRDVYPTPSVSCRTIILSPDRTKVLLVQEAKDEGWSFPGGWCEIGLSPTESARKEVWEEAGYDCRITNMIGALDRYSGMSTSGAPEYILVYEGKLVGQPHKPTYEILAVDWFPVDNLPRISIKNHPQQMLRMLDCALHRKSLLD
ncbi:MAG TPA: hypothetical protein DEA32_02335 [Firmicutes bacterium]|nr:hypothetical protein [Bacillota bacterium]